MSHDQSTYMDLLRKYEPERAADIMRQKTREELSRHIWSRRNSPNRPSETEQWAWREHMVTLPKGGRKR